ncbi:hypothetical protein UY3_05506 [Chelonia mydas]|uniref:Uncharacterized protein n=1 Tax=Chelonia mydas TaxID=8469 RepID=M7BJD3_CHEMY|nr:hypothetical protein UY3_05506 [Chelonia mydas]
MQEVQQIKGNEHFPIHQDLNNVPQHNLKSRKPFRTHALNLPQCDFDPDEQGQCSPDIATVLPKLLLISRITHSFRFSTLYFGHLSCSLPMPSPVTPEEKVKEFSPDVLHVGGGKLLYTIRTKVLDHVKKGRTGDHLKGRHVPAPKKENEGQRVET